MCEFYSDFSPPLLYFPAPLHNPKQGGQVEATAVLLRVATIACNAVFAHNKSPIFVWRAPSLRASKAVMFFIDNKPNRVASQT